jgi:hypothetical protein
MLQLLERNAQAAGNTILGLLAALSMDGFERNGQWQKMRYPARRKKTRRVQRMALSGYVTAMKEREKSLFGRDASVGC